MRVSQNQLKLIRSLQQKKNRQKNQLFVVEGKKGVADFLQSPYSLKHLFCEESEFSNYAEYAPVLINEVELKKVSTLSSPNKVLALFEIPKIKDTVVDGVEVLLDGINDPGNLGTIIRMCDWFGVEKMVCSKDTVDCYNSKVVQSTMGSLPRIQLVYTDLEAYIKQSSKWVYITDMVGENVYQTQLSQEALLVMGNEANGVRDYLKNLIENKLTIPRFGTQQETESLNVAMATSILLSEFKRRL